MLGLDELPAPMRRNLLYESSYCSCTGVISGLAMLSQVTVLSQSLQGGALEATVITAALPAAMVVQPLWAELARRYRLQTLALISGALRCLPLLLMGWVEEAWAFAGLIVAYYFLAGPVTLAVPSLYKYNYADTHRGRIIGLLRFVQNGVAMPVMLLSAWLMDREPTLYRVIFPLGGVIGLFGLFFYARLHIPHDSPAERFHRSERPTLRSIREVITADRNFRWFQMTIFLTGAGFLMSRAIWVYLLRETFGLSQLQMTFLSQVMPVILGAVTSPAWGAFIDRTSPVAGRIAFALLGIFAYAALFASFYTEWLALAYVGAVLRGLVLGAAEVATTAGNLYFSVKRERAALYESISSLFQGIRGLTMPLLGYAFFLGIGFYLFLVPTVLNLWSLVLALKLWRHDRAESPEEALARRTAPREAEVSELVEE